MSKKSIDSLDIALSLEKFFKQNKKAIYSLFVLLIIVLGATKFYFYKKQMDLIESNSIYNLLTTNESKNITDDENLLKSKNKPLYDLYVANKSIKSEDVKRMISVSSEIDSDFYKKVLEYQIASISKDKTRLESANNLPYLGDLSKILLTYLYLEDGKKRDALPIVALIDTKSPMYNLSNMIKHYSIDKK